MPLRKYSLSPFFSRREIPAPLPAELAPLEGNPSVEPRSLWRTGLLLATSAAFGGIAVAIWHRRTLAQMRQPDEEP